MTDTSPSLTPLDVFRAAATAHPFDLTATDGGIGVLNEDGYWLEDVEHVATLHDLATTAAGVLAVVDGLAAENAALQQQLADAVAAGLYLTS